MKKETNKKDKILFFFFMKYKLHLANLQTGGFFFFIFWALRTVKGQSPI